MYLASNLAQINQKLKKAHIRQAKIWYSDKNIDKYTTDRIKIINKAYMTLYDDEMRAHSDDEYKKYKLIHNYFYDECYIKYSQLNEWIQKSKIRAHE